MTIPRQRGAETVVCTGSSKQPVQLYIVRTDSTGT